MTTDKLDIEATRKHLLPALRTTVHTTLRQALNELEEARKWINDLQSGMYINCVYCGHCYGPKDETPSSMADILRKHVEQCVRHPLFAANKRIAELEKKLPSPIGSVPEHWPHRYNANSEPCDMIDGPCACGAWHSLDEVWVQSGINRYGEKP